MKSVPAKYRQAGYEVYENDGTYRGHTADIEEAQEYADKYPGGYVVNAKNRKQVIYRNTGGKE